VVEAALSGCQNAGWVHGAKQRETRDRERDKRDKVLDEPTNQPTNHPTACATYSLIAFVCKHKYKQTTRGVDTSSKQKKTQPKEAIWKHMQASCLAYDKHVLRRWKEKAKASKKEKLEKAVFYLFLRFLLSSLYAYDCMHML
jgi:hypothetical protein